jgi:hypothetical protein
MTNRERLHQLVEELAEEELSAMLDLVERVRACSPRMADLPDDWRTGDAGTPAQNWVAAVHRSRGF